IVGVTLRLLNSAYRFADLSIEGAFLMGLLGGRVVGPIGGAIITIPALISPEWLAMPAASPAGRAGGPISPGNSSKANPSEFRPIYIPKYPQGSGAAAPQCTTLLGNGASYRMRRP